ncbi:MAG: alpha/beta hydrolase [Actinomycetota bacterium]
MGVLFEHKLSLAGFDSRALELDGEGPPLLLLHGWSDSADTWRPALDLLRRHGRHAVALDLPGYGTAARLDPDQPVLRQHDRFVRAALAHFAPEGGAVIAGNSLGGVAALRAAEHEESGLAGIVPIAPAGFDMAGWFLVIQGERLIRGILASPVPVPEAIVRGAVGRVYRQVAFARPTQVSRRVISSFTSHVGSSSDVARILASGRRLRAELADPFRLDRIGCPVLIVWGDSDRMVFASGAERVLREVDGSRLEVIEKCGHCPQLEAPERLVQLLEEFCADPVAATAA